MMQMVVKVVTGTAGPDRAHVTMTDTDERHGRTPDQAGAQSGATALDYLSEVPRSDSHAVRSLTSSPQGETTVVHAPNRSSSHDRYRGGRKVEAAVILAVENAAC
jgi:hypothetical protein